MRKPYSELSFFRQILANLDKCSNNGESNVVHTPYGIVKMYHKSAKRGRFYSISASKVFHNGGSLKIGTLAKRLDLLESINLTLSNKCFSLGTITPKV